eukprot:snap_masked-scaffold_31-processed-gene-2.38-mRNA-1 protein AED:1.00 eAED:1.00 QI:0/-1/0/0/-1/1/1/0/363
MVIQYWDNVKAIWQYRTKEVTKILENNRKGYPRFKGVDPIALLHNITSFQNIYFPKSQKKLSREDIFLLEVFLLENNITFLPLDLLKNHDYCVQNGNFSSVEEVEKLTELKKKIYDLSIPSFPARSRESVRVKLVPLEPRASPPKEEVETYSPFSPTIIKMVLDSKELAQFSLSLESRLLRGNETLLKVEFKQSKKKIRIVQELASHFFFDVEHNKLMLPDKIFPLIPCLRETLRNGKIVNFYENFKETWKRKLHPDKFPYHVILYNLSYVPVHLRKYKTKEIIAQTVSSSQFEIIREKRLLIIRIDNNSLAQQVYLKLSSSCSSSLFSVDKTSSLHYNFVQWWPRDPNLVLLKSQIDFFNKK